MGAENIGGKHPEPASGGRIEAVPAPLAPHKGIARVATFLGKIVDPLSLYGAVLGGAALTVLMFMTLVDSFGRYLLNRPVYGAEELTQYFMAIAIGFALAYCALNKGHIRVDLILQYISKKANQWFDILAYAVSCVFYAFITVETWSYAFQQLASGVTSSVLYIPVYPFVFILTVSMALVTLMFFRDFLKSIEKVVE